MGAQTFHSWVKNLQPEQRQMDKIALCKLAFQAGQEHLLERIAQELESRFHCVCAAGVCKCRDLASVLRELHLDPECPLKKES